VMGDVHKRLGLFDRALDLLGQSSALDARVAAPRSAELARTRFLIGEVHLFEERFDEAEAALREALQAQRSMPDPPVAEIADTLNLLGRLENLRKRFDVAEPLLDEALDLRRDLFGEDSLPVAHSLQSLGLLRQGQRRADDALALFRRALDIRRRHLGPRHPRTAELLQNVASALQRTGQVEEALSTMAEALDATIASYGEEHQGVGWTLSGMAYSLQQLGRLDEAIAHDERAVEILRRRGGGPSGVGALVQLSRHLTQAGQLRRAEAAAREALEWLGDSPDDPDPKRSNVLVDLGTILTLDGRYAEAGVALEETLRLDIATYGEDHPYVAQDRYKLGELARLSGEPLEALVWLDAALERQRRLRPGSNALGLSLIARGETLRELRRYGDAEASFRAALEVFAVETPADHPDVWTATLGLGAALADGGQVDEGRALMEEAARGLEAKLGAESSRVQEAWGRLAARL
ncbi:MAG: tetratricopeptide repeat protein, partial [Acidobacteriota bacterium]